MKTKFDLGQFASNKFTPDNTDMSTKSKARLILIGTAGKIAVLVGGAIVVVFNRVAWSLMLCIVAQFLWNWIIPAVFPCPYITQQITLSQAFGLLLLCAISFKR
jgi:hypothetical protein